MTTLTTLTREAVPAASLPRLEDKVRRAGRKCQRWGLPAPVLTASEPRLEKDPSWDPGIYGRREDAPLIPVVDISLTAPESIGIPGWSLLARIDFLPDGGHVIIRSPGVETELPEVSDPSACDHCRSRRHRKDTFLVLEEASGDIRQVGRNCLKDHLGYDPERLLWWSAFARDVDDLMGEHAPRTERLMPTSWVMLTASRIASRIGYMSARRAEELMDERGRGKPPTTRQRVDQYGYDLDDAKRDRKALKAVEEFDAEFPDDEGAHRLMAATAEAINGLTGREGEWQDNIRSICGQSAIRPRHMGIAVSAVILGLKAIDAPTRKDPVVSQYVGTVGAKVSVAGTITRLVHTESDWGSRTGVFVRAEAEQADLIWWASKYIDDADLPVDSAVTISGTVKAQEVDRYSNRPTTTLTRARITELEA